MRPGVYNCPFQKPEAQLVSDLGAEFEIYMKGSPSVNSFSFPMGNTLGVDALSTGSRTPSAAVTFIKIEFELFDFHMHLFEKGICRTYEKGLLSDRVNGRNDCSLVKLSLF